METNKTLILSLLFLALMVAPFSSAATTAEGIIGIGVLFFLVIISLLFIIGGFVTFNKKSVWRALSIGAVVIGFVFLYGATTMAQLYLESSVTTIGGTEVYEGLWVWIVRGIGWSYWAFLLGTAYYFVKIFRQIKKDYDSHDGWDEGNY